MPQRRVYLYLGVAVLIIIIGITLRFITSPHNMVSPAGVTVVDKGGREIKGSKPPSIGGRFTLISHHGRPMTDADFRGKNIFVFFGFTNCPDVCPITLNKLSLIQDELKNGKEKLGLYTMPNVRNK